LKNARLLTSAATSRSETRRNTVPKTADWCASTSAAKADSSPARLCCTRCEVESRLSSVMATCAPSGTTHVVAPFLQRPSQPYARGLPAEPQLDSRGQRAAEAL